MNLNEISPEKPNGEALTAMWTTGDLLSQVKQVRENLIWAVNNHATLEVEQLGRWANAEEFLREAEVQLFNAQFELSLVAGNREPVIAPPKIFPGDEWKTQ